MTKLPKILITEEELEAAREKLPEIIAAFVEAFELIYDAVMDAMSTVVAWAEENGIDLLAVKEEKE